MKNQVRMLCFYYNLNTAKKNQQLLYHKVVFFQHSNTCYVYMYFVGFIYEE